MTIAKLGHYAIRVRDLDASLAFYTQVLGLKAGFRPPFDFPGAWLYLGDDVADYGTVHLVAEAAGSGDLAAYLGDRSGQADVGSGAVDHIAFRALGFRSMRARLEQLAVAFRERQVPALGLRQIFVEDPSGITIELNFPAVEADGDADAGQSTAPVHLLEGEAS